MNTTELNPAPDVPRWLVVLIAALLIAVCCKAMAEGEAGAGAAPATGQRVERVTHQQQQPRRVAT